MPEKREKEIKKIWDAFMQRLGNESRLKGSALCETDCDICNKHILVGGEMHIFMYPDYNAKKLCKNCLIKEVTRVCPEKLEEILNPQRN